MNKKKLNNLIKLIINKYGISSDKQLRYLTNKLNIPLNYIGFVEDLKELKKNGGYIFNLGNQEIQGTHWTALYKEGTEAFYFDSFAVPFEDKLLEIPTNIKNIIYNDFYQLQGIDETLCGIWCILFLYHMQNSKKIKLIDRFKEFTKSYKDIDGNYSSGSSLL